MSSGKKKLRPSTKITYSQDEVRFLRSVGLALQREIREKEGHVETFCFRHGFSRSSVSALISGKKNFQILTIKRLAKALGYADYRQFLAKV